MKSIPSFARFPDSSNSDNAAAALEALQALRRGLSRSRGFSLFIAVCNRTDERDQLVTMLGESLPGKKLQVARLHEKTTDPLTEVLSQVPEPAGPVVIVGFERATPRDRLAQPILQSLNARRPDWSQKLRQPVVLGMPEYVLGFVAREAPDFLDWRSDTVHFPDLSDHELRSLREVIWPAAVSASRSVEGQHVRRLSVNQAREHALSVLCKAEEERTLLALQEAKVVPAFEEEMDHDL